MTPSYEMKDSGRTFLPSPLDLADYQGIRWNEVSRVIFKTFKPVQCPICLSDSKEMLAPQITKCGHIFCLPCMLQHLHLRGRNGRVLRFVDFLAAIKDKCPVCKCFVKEGHLKDIYIEQYKPLN